MGERPADVASVGMEAAPGGRVVAVAAAASESVPALKLKLEEVVAGDGVEELEIESVAAARLTGATVNEAVEDILDAALKDDDLPIDTDDPALEDGNVPGETVEAVDPIEELALELELYAADEGEDAILLLPEDVDPPAFTHVEPVHF